MTFARVRIKQKQMEKDRQDTGLLLQNFHDICPCVAGIIEIVGNVVIARELTNNAARFFALGNNAAGKALFGGMTEANAFWAEQCRHCRCEGLPVSFEYEHASVSGKHLLSVVIAWLGPDNDGRPRFTFVAEDVCRRKRWDEEIQRSQARLADVLEHINDGFLAVNYQWQITYGNRRVALNSKYEQDELPGRNLWEVFPEFINTPLEADYRKAMTQRVFRNGEIQWGTSNTWYDIRIFPSPEGISIYWADITERKAAEENLHRINAQLENRVAERTEELARESCERLKTMEKLHQRERLLMEQNRHAAMGEMIGNIAHQWRQPLNSLALLLQRMPLFFETGRFDLPFLEDSVNKSMDLINHMSQTIDDFRNFFRPEKCRTTFKLAEVVAKTQALVEASFKDQGITVEVRTEDDPLVDGYPNEYSQIILNILINARDAFLQRRDITNPRIVIRLGLDGDKTVVTIADNAGGIPEKIMPKIFDPYFTTKASDKGTGIGLHMAKTIIEKNMNGLLTARNTGEGAEFRIEV